MAIYKVYSNITGYQGDITRFEDLVHYIAGTPPEENLIITDIFDNLITSTIGNLLDRVPDVDFLKRLQPALIPLQMGSEEIRIFEISNVK